MYQQSKLFERELRFTRAYREHYHDDKAVREYYCLAEQIPSLFITPRGDDLIAGRIDRPMIGFFPCLEGDTIDKVAFGIDEAACGEAIAKMRKNASYTTEEIEEAQRAFDFWKRENTNAKIRSQIPDQWGFSMGMDNYNLKPAAIHPIYRIASSDLDMKRLFSIGLPSLISSLNEYAGNTRNAQSAALYKSMAGVLELLRMVLDMYAKEAGRLAQLSTDPVRRKELTAMKESLLRVRDGRPETLQDALQLQVVYMLSGRVVELGRLDNYLCEFYRRDLKLGVLTKEQAIRLVDNFFSIIEQERGRDTRAIIGGVGREHPESADEFDMLVLNVLERRKFHFYPQVSLRCYTGMDERIFDRALELIGKGYTFPLLYNDDINVPSVMRAMDVPRREAEQYAFFGCGEYILEHMSIGTPNTTMNMASILLLALNNGKDPMTGSKWGLSTGEINDDMTFDDLMCRYKKQVDYFADIAGSFEELIYDVCNREAAFLLTSILYDDCIPRGKPVLGGGIHHLGGTVETYGNITASDSLSAIKEVVFDRKLFSITHLVKALNANFEGYEAERKQLLSAAKYGNDNETADRIAVEVHEYLCNAIRRQRCRTRMDSFLVVVINNSMNVTLGHYVGATPDGRKAREFLSNGNGAYNGQDKEGITSLIHSITKLDTSIHAGANQNLKISMNMFKNNYSEVKALIRSFFAMGGQQLNLTVVNQAELEDAMIHPERHENLIVRVGGFSARFVYLDPEIQRDILLRTAY